MTKQDILKKMQAKIDLYRICRNENYNNKDYESSMKFDILANGLEEGLRYAERLDEPPAQEGCESCMNDSNGTILTLDSFGTGDSKVNFCPACGRKLKTEVENG